MKTKKHILFLFILVVSGMNNTSRADLFFSKIDSFQVILNNDQLKLPGETFDIGILSFHKKGKTRKTTGLAGGSVFWWNYKIEVKGGTFQSGKITVNRQLLPSKGKYIEIEVYPRKQPELSQRILLPLNYETEIYFKPTNNFDKAPGSVIEGEIVAKFDNGITRRLSKFNRNRKIENYVLSGSGGRWNKESFFIEPDFLNIENHSVHLFVQSLLNPELCDTFSVLLDYKHSYRLQFAGMDGNPGFSGSNGSDGFTGYHGNDGEYGQNGEMGYNGPDVGVWSDMYFDSLLNCYLLYVYAENFQTGKEYRYLINPDGGNFTVISEGGNGGRGGEGGNGGNGGRGIDGKIWYEQKEVEKIVKKPQTRKVEKKITRKITDENGKEKEIEETVWEEETYYVDAIEHEIITIEHHEPGEPGGDGGNGGGGGFGGPGGDGGNIYFYFTEDSRPLENLFIANNDGGSGGMHGNGGRGGNGGSGGLGNPNGPDGRQGRNGMSALGWAPDGWQGNIYRQATPEFYIEQPINEAVAEKNTASGSGF